MLYFDVSEASLDPFTLNEEDKYLDLSILSVMLNVQLDERLVS